MLIGVTDTLGSEHKFNRYLDWLRSTGANPDITTLSHTLDNAEAVKQCDALVLTGGHDVDPSLYHHPVRHPKIVEVDRKRDDFERSVLDVALGLSIPVLGICRGLQLVNVHFGGTLIADLEDVGYRSHRSVDDSMEVRHPIRVEQVGLLACIVGSPVGVVNSSHHQAVAAPGKGLRVSARSDDGVIEAMEFADGGERSFLLLVQWHPERMETSENPYSIGILGAFLHAAEFVQH